MAKIWKQSECLRTDDGIKKKKTGTYTQYNPSKLLDKIMQFFCYCRWVWKESNWMISLGGKQEIQNNHFYIWDIKKYSKGLINGPKQ